MVADTLARDRATWKERLLWLGLSYLLFYLIYSFTGWYAGRLEHVESFMFRLEQQMPFISCMVIPYMSSGVFFAYVFCICSYKDELHLLARRLNFVTLVSGIFFMLFPLQFSLARPQVDNECFRFLFRFLELYDTPYNQAPSLHISYACIFWSVIARKVRGGWKIGMAAWLWLMGLSTLFIYQHHLIDVITALILVYVTFLLFPGSKKRNTN